VTQGFLVAFRSRGPISTVSDKRGAVAQVYALSGDNNPGVCSSGGKAVENLRKIGTSLGIVYSENILYGPRNSDDTTALDRRKATT
jgi:hypothetical protein